MVNESLLFGISVVAGSFLGPLVFTAWLRNEERYAPEPWGAVLRAFAWGATGAVVLTLAFSLIFRVDRFLQPIGLSSAAASAVVVAPVVEEATKGLGLRWVDDLHVELEDGLVYGAAAGLGFSATENLAYGVTAFMETGLESLVLTVGVRTFTSSLLHASASALLGLGLWKRRAGESGAWVVVGAYLLAVLLHAVFNVAASVQLGVAFLAAVAIAIGGYAWVRRRVRELDRVP